MRNLKKLQKIALASVFNIICFALSAQNTFPPTGNAGIGVTPQYTLDILTSATNDGINLRNTTTGFIRIAANSYGAGAYNSLTQAGDAGIIYGGPAAGSGNFGFVISPWSTGLNGLRVDNNGNVGIATANTNGYQLAVNGSAIFTKAVVKLYANWPDYVFKKEYQLPSLESIAQFIKYNNHLPGIPSEKEIAENGVDLGQMNAKLLEKIEELTLYVIELKNENKEIKKQLTKLQDK